MPSLRFGSGQIYKSSFENTKTGIDTRDGAQIMVQVTPGRMSLSHLDFGKDIANIDKYANAFANDPRIGDSSAPEEILTETSMPYLFTLLGSAAVKAAVVGTALDCRFSTSEGTRNNRSQPLNFV